MSEIRVTSVVGENGGDRVGLTTGLTVGPLTGTTGIGATITHHGHAQFAGVCTATSFVGNGAGLTNVTAGLLLRKTAYEISRQAISPSSFPLDDTIPQRSEGTEFFSQAYTPTNTSNCDLYIYCSAMVRERTNVADDVGMGLFISDQNDALRVVTELMAGHGHGALVYLHHKMPSWGVSAKTFSLRSHKGDGINYAADGYYQQKYGASTHASLFTIEEIAT